MRIIGFFALCILTSCVSSAPSKEEEPICPAVYDPYLCMVTVEEETYAAHGINQCLALSKLQDALNEASVTPGPTDAVICGKVNGL